MPSRRRLLGSRGMLDETVVYWTTEFGRMPCRAARAGTTIHLHLRPGSGAPDLLLRRSRDGSEPTGHLPLEADVP
jgi:hypothetical protein